MMKKELVRKEEGTTAIKEKDYHVIDRYPPFKVVYENKSKTIKESPKQES